ncbi:uncharacterized protein LOC120327933 [Styela clava]
MKINSESTALQAERLYLTLKIFPMASTIALLVRIAIKTKDYTKAAKDRRKSDECSTGFREMPEQQNECEICTSAETDGDTCAFCGKSTSVSCEITSISDFQEHRFEEVAFSAISRERENIWQENRNDNNRCERKGFFQTLYQRCGKRGLTVSPNNRVSPVLHFTNSSAGYCSTGVYAVQLNDSTSAGKAESDQHGNNIESISRRPVVCRQCLVTTQAQYPKLFNVITNTSLTKLANITS